MTEYLKLYFLNLYDSIYTIYFQPRKHYSCRGSIKDVVAILKVLAVDIVLVSDP